MDAVRSYLTLGYVPGHSCIFTGISKLAPGHTLTWSDGASRKTRYWDVAFDLTQTHSDAHYAEQLLATLQQAVAVHMRSDVPVGILLSGGVDSSTVVALASSQVSSKIKTFSVGFDEEDYSELAWARRVAARYNTDHVEVIVRDRDVSVLPDIALYLDEPFADPSALPIYFICREAARHVRVCLTGDGADEVFAGYTRYRNALAYRYMDAVPPAVRRAVSRLGLMTPAALWGHGFVERLGMDEANRYLGLVGVFSSTESSGLLSVCPHPLEVGSTFAPFLAQRDGELLTRMQHVDQKTYLPDDILVKVDRMSMHNSLEIRPPFLDHVVVEFGNRCPPRLKLRGRTGKYILKQAIREYLPPEILQRPKMGFGIPIKHWFRDGLEGLAEDMLLSASARSASFLRRGAVSRLLQSHRYGLRDLSRRIWSLVMLEQWCRCYLV